MSRIVSLAEKARRSSAVERPIPEEPPVIRMCLFVKAVGEMEEGVRVNVLGAIVLEVGG